MQGWAIAHFENVRSLFFLCEKSAIWKFAHFSHIRSFWKSEYAIAQSHIFKERKNVRSHIRTFSKSKNVGMCKNVRKKCESQNFPFSHFKKIANCSFEKGECAKMCKKVQKVGICPLCTYSHTRSLQKSDCAITLFSHFFKELRTVRSHIRTFSKGENVRMCDCPTLTECYKMNYCKGKPHKILFYSGRKI